MRGLRGQKESAILLLHHHKGGLLILINITLTEEDYILYNIFHFFHSPLNKKRYWTNRLLPFLLYTLIIIFMFLLDIKWDLLLIEAMLLYLYALIRFVLYPRMVKKNIRKNILKTKKEGRLPYSPEYSIDYGEDTFIMTTPTRTIHYAYSDILEICKEDDAVYLLVGAVEAVILPNRCLDQKDELLRFLYEKMEDSHSK